jgi:hypothetical protein
MTPRLSQGCTWVLLLAMMLAMAAGLMAWGPVHFPLVLRGDFPMPPAGAATPLDALGCLPLGVVGAWGAWVVHRDRWPRALRKPWFYFFVSSALSAAASALFHLQPSAVVHAAGHAFGATAMTMLALAFAAERMDIGFGSRAAVASAGAIAGVAALWWLAGHGASGQGDLRALLFLECLPVLLLPAGALSLPGHFTRATDWALMLSAYVAARAVGLLDSPIAGATAGFGGHALMHLLLAGVAAWPLYRAWAASRRVDSPAASPPDSTQRRTSFNTSS